MGGPKEASHWNRWKISNRFRNWQLLQTLLVHPLSLKGVPQAYWLLGFVRYSVPNGYPWLCLPTNDGQQRNRNRERTSSASKDKHRKQIGVPIVRRPTWQCWSAFSVIPQSRSANLDMGQMTDTVLMSQRSGIAGCLNHYKRCWWKNTDNFSVLMQTFLILSPDAWLIQNWTSIPGKARWNTRILANRMVSLNVQSNLNSRQKLYFCCLFTR